MPTANFTSSNCGEKSGVATSDTGMNPGDTLAINGNTDLSTCIVGSSGAKVGSIMLQPNSGFYNLILDVLGQGPSGAFSGSLDLYFTDATGDTYHLMLYSGTWKQHTLSYDSDKPKIVKIEWK